MSVFTMVVWIVVVGCLSGIVHDYLKTRRLEARSNTNMDQREFDALKERVSVLEKIVTDERYDLRRELNQLERHG
ncbi:MAG: hypothetical protein AB8B93_06835 [Pseudomonadales bacterium]